MSARRNRLANFFGRRWLLAISAVGFLVVVMAAAIGWLNPRLTRYVEGDSFRHALEMETAKGLHFEAGQYAPIYRIGFLAAETAQFRAAKGRKTLTDIDAHDITVKFNPWGVFLRRWQLDDVHIQSGEAGIQTYEPKPEPSPAKPWFAIFLPNRVYLKQVRSEPADVTWRFLGEKGGFFGTRLLITPNGRDFEYRATGGTFKLALVPDLQLRTTHLYVNHDVMKIYNLDLVSTGENASVAGTIHAHGEAQLKGNKSIQADANFASLPLSQWASGSWKNHVSGTASGEVHYRSENMQAESSSGHASLRVDGGRIVRLPFLEKLATITGKRSLETLALDACALDLDWRYPHIELKNIAFEDKGKLRIEGAISLQQSALSGALRLGVAREYLVWLPRPDEIFPHEEGGYLWTTIHLSGTLQEPKQDLSPRIAEELKESPEAALGIFFRAVGDWFRRAFVGQ
jgi:hypothetical protein